MVDFAKLLEQSRDPEYQKKSRQEREAREAAVLAKEKMVNGAISALTNPDVYERLSEWEKDFVIGCRKTMNRQFVLTEKQEPHLLRIIEREFPGFTKTDTSAPSADNTTENDMAVEQKAGNGVTVEEKLKNLDEGIELIESQKKAWQATADRFKGVLIGERFIVLDDSGRAYMTFAENTGAEGESGYWDQPDEALTGVMYMSAEQAVAVRDEWTQGRPEYAPFVVRDFEEFAKERVVESDKLIANLIARRKVVQAQEVEPKEYVVTMRSRTTAGVDTDRIRVFKGQRVEDVASRIAGGYGAEVESISNLDGTPYVPPDMREEVRRKLAEIGFDTAKYDDQMHGKMIVERAKSLDDAELQRVFANAVLGDFCVKYMKAARDAGLTIADVYRDIPDGTLEHDDFIEALHYETGLSNMDAIALSDKLQPLAAKHFKLCVIDLADGLSKQQEAARDVIETDIRSLVSGLKGVKDAAFIYDARGTTVGIQFDSGRYNSFSHGGMYKVPVDSKAVKELGSSFWLEYEARAAAPTAHYVVTITETGNAAFVDSGRKNEVARIVQELSSRIEEEGVPRDSVKLYDLNGNPVGKAAYQQNAPEGDVPPGQLRCFINTRDAAVMDDAQGEISRMLRVAADKLRDGLTSFKVHDVNGNAVGQMDMPDLPSLEKDGVVDMALARGEDRVYWADDTSMMSLADGEFRFVVTGPEFEPGYGQESGEAWLVNAKGEVAPGYEGMDTVREFDFRKLTKDEAELLQQVIDGALTLEQFESRFDDEVPEND